MTTEKDPNFPENSEESPKLQRLQRVLAMAGLGSRRHCEALITEGRVEVDGQLVDKLGSRVDPDTQKILVDGVRLKIERFQYYAVNKPPGVVSTSRDQSGRTRVIDLIRTDSRVYTVGRLDKSSEGLILVTNDGDLANRLTHPKYGVEKTYLAQTVGIPLPEQLQQLERGVFLAEGKAKAKSARLVKRNKLGAIIEIVLEEGRNREIRRLLARIGHKVTRLQRVAIGPIGIGFIGVGEHRKLSPEEVRALRDWKPNQPHAASPKRTTETSKFKKSIAHRDSERGDRESLHSSRSKRGSRPQSFDRKSSSPKKTVRADRGSGKFQKGPGNRAADSKPRRGKLRNSSRPGGPKGKRAR